MKLVVAGTILSIAAAAPAFAADAPYKIVDKFPMPNGGWDYATSDLGKGLIYWVRSDHTDVIDSKTNKVSSLKSPGDGHMAVVIPGTTLIVIPMRMPADTTRIVDTANDTVVADLPSGKSPDGAVYDPFSKNVFVANHAGGDITEVDPMAKKVVATIKVYHGKLEFPASDGQGHVFVNMQQKGDIGVIDVKSGKMSGTYVMSGCEDNSGLAYVPGANLLISSCGNGTARVLAADTGKQIASIPIGKGPDAVVYDPSKHVAFIPCGESGKLDVLSVADADHVKKIQELDLPSMARTGAIDPQGRLYTMSATPDTSKPRGGGNRYPPKKGTFAMVVVGQ